VRRNRFGRRPASPSNSHQASHAFLAYRRASRPQLGVYPRAHHRCSGCSRARCGWRSLSCCIDTRSMAGLVPLPGVRSRWWTPRARSTAGRLSSSPSPRRRTETGSSRRLALRRKVAAFFRISRSSRRTPYLFAEPGQLFVLSSGQALPPSGVDIGPEPASAVRRSRPGPDPDIPVGTDLPRAAD